MRTKIVAGNWKMHGSKASVTALLQAIKAGAHSAVEVVVFPTFVHIPLAADLLAGSAIAFGGQNLHEGESGAFTGEVSGSMLVDYGCKYVLVGHSERRSLFHEDLMVVAKKFKAAMQCGLIPILCVGETLNERKSGITEIVIRDQLDSVIHAEGVEVFKTAVIAYEPVWAIGTGLTATPDEAQAVHAYIRNHLAKHSVDVANTARILYGGSVKADNAKQLFAMPDVDGGLVGGASLDAKSFVNICNAAS